MRIEKDGISIRPIPGTHSVLFGFDATEAARRGLLGFALGKRRPGGRIDWMNGFKVFPATRPLPAPGALKPTNEQPVQDFQWGDYNAAPDTTTDYVVRPMYGVEGGPPPGTPGGLRDGADIDLAVTTLNRAGASHRVHFNMGVVPGQAFARRFGNVFPTPAEQENPGDPKTAWLSRGLLEAALAFIGRAKGGRFELRVAAYEFTYRPILAALRNAALSGAKVRVSVATGYRRGNGDIYQDSTTLQNWQAILGQGREGPGAFDLSAMARKGLTLHPRTRAAGIPHNKFIVLIEDGHPIAVWTGSTNFTPSGFLGQSNLAHEIEDGALAEAYLAYWEMLATDPAPADLATFCAQRFPDPGVPPLGDAIRPVFSPRPAGMLSWYGARMAEAKEAGFITAAFGIAPEIGAAFTGPNNTLRLVLAENAGRGGAAEVMAAVEADPDNIVAMGGHLPEKSAEAGLDSQSLDRWFLREERHRDRGHIFYIHTKLMMIDPLGNAPQIFSGSANFSTASVEDNDENMLLMSGARAAEVAPIFVNEFMRMHRHLYFRTVALKGGASSEAGELKPDESWQTAHFTPGREKFRKRELFR